MSEIDDPLGKLDLKGPSELLAGLDYNSVVEFFSVLSRLEYALKESGYIREKDKHATVAWLSFAKSMEGKLSAVGSRRLNKAVEYLNAYPPKTQMNNREWEVESTSLEDSDSKSIFYATKVRNNLFHGGKHNSTDVERDMILIRSSLDILYGCLLVNPEIKRSYEVVY